jgi:uroporphyrinogen decarboxylase
MNPVTHRDRVLMSMQRKEPDRVPLFYRDVPEVERRLLSELCLPDRGSLLRFLDIDFRWVAPEYVGPSLVIEEGKRIRDIWGIEYRYVEAGLGRYWEIATNPLADTDDIAEMSDYPWPKIEWFDFSTLASQIDQYDGYAVMTSPGESSPSILDNVEHLLGMERALMEAYLNPEFLHAIFDRVTEFVTLFIERMLEASGGRLDFVRIGDDYGTQRGLLMGLPQWKEFVGPSLKAVSQVCKRHGAYYYHHSCGGIRELIPSLIEAGVDVLDPVQVLAQGMTPAELKAEFGDRICFSGGVDEQELLIHGSAEDVRKGVRSLLDDMARGGGFFIGPTHNLQEDIPTRNILAMYEAARDWQ